MPSDRVLIIGGGPAGIEAARNLADLGIPVTIVEARERLGGMPIHAQYAALTPDLEDAETAMNRRIEPLLGHPLVDLRCNSAVTGSSGTAGDFRVRVAVGGKEDVVPAAAIIVATGFQHFDPGRETQMYGYYEFDDVITLPDCEKMLKEHKVVRPSNGQPPECVAFIQCVGSRDRQIGNEFCSKVCCGIASKEAIEIRQQLPNCKVFIFYIDMRMYGYWENELYWPAQEKHKVNYVRGIVSEVLKKGDRLVIRGEDTTLGRPVEAPMDLVVLSVGMEPSKGTREMAKLLGLPQNPYGYLDTVGVPLDTVSTAVEGVFAAGSCTGPADLEDSISAGATAAMRAAVLLRKKRAGAEARG
ncbi:MAG: CoB--CoM heterodisulfide reductase iron-sulfur subunit A family protein [Deltaproteobacteria bacterium]|nr:CoB--CoM heterodisulfide reductase iron-sulfur subunit A family protein [Deltaproteobacteria bacterium]